MFPEPILDLWVTGPPVGRRLQVVTIKGRSSIQHTTPSRKYLARIRAKARQVWEAKPLESPVAAVLTAHIPMAASWSNKKKRETVGKLAANLPDGDNIVKLGLDGIVGSRDAPIVLKDDKQVVKCYVERRWAYRTECGLSIKLYTPGQVELRGVMSG